MFAAVSVVGEVETMYLSSLTRSAAFDVMPRVNLTDISDADVRQTVRSPSTSTRVIVATLL